MSEQVEEDHDPITLVDAIQRGLDPLTRYGLKPKKLLGVGGTSEVILVEDEQGRHFAMKRLLGPYRSQRMWRDAIFFEGFHLSLLSSRRVLRCHRILTHPLPEAIIRSLDEGEQLEGTRITSQEEVSLLLEHVDGVHLRTVLKQSKREQYPLEQMEVASLIWDIYHGLKVLHSAQRPGDRPCPITHGDLSPTNIMLRADGSGVLIDLSSSCSQLNHSHSYLRRGKPKYQSPVLSDVMRHSERVTGDLYSMGRIWLELVTGQLPSQDIPISFRSLKGAGWPPRWARAVSGLTSENHLWRLQAFNELGRNVIWGEPRSAHQSYKRVARSSLATRVRRSLSMM